MSPSPCRQTCTWHTPVQTLGRKPRNPTENVLPDGCCHAHHQRPHQPRGDPQLPNCRIFVNLQTTHAAVDHKCDDRHGIRFVGEMFALHDIVVKPLPCARIPEVSSKDFSLGCGNGPQFIEIVANLQVNLIMCFDSVHLGNRHHHRKPGRKRTTLPQKRTKTDNRQNNGNDLECTNGNNKHST